MSDDETNVSWVGGIYRKFEALCVEADDIIRQEAHGFIENHLQPAGSNVKQFYSELVREMVSQSSPDGSTEEAQPDLVLKETTDSFTNVSFEVADEKKQIDVDESERSDAVQSLVSAELGNSGEEEPLNVEHVQDNQSPCEQIRNSNPSSVSGNAAKLDESCILVNDDDEEYVLALRERRRWCYKKNWKQQVLALASKSLKQKQKQKQSSLCSSCVEIRGHEEAAFSPSIAHKESADSDWEII